MSDQNEARIRGEVALDFVDGLRQQGCTQAFNVLHNSAQFDARELQGIYLDLVAACHSLPQLPEEVKTGFSWGQADHIRAVYFAFDGICLGQTRVAALIKPFGGPLQSDFLTFSAGEANKEGQVMARIAKRMQARADLALV